MPKELHNRLAKIGGQINAIDRMVLSDADPVDILVQIHAAKAALTKAAEMIAVDYMNSRLPEADRAKAETVIRRLSGLS